MGGGEPDPSLRLFWSAAGALRDGRGLEMLVDLQVLLLLLLLLGLGIVCMVVDAWLLLWWWWK